jgi:hypothetical protein
MCAEGLEITGPIPFPTNQSQYCSVHTIRDIPTIHRWLFKTMVFITFHQFKPWSGQYHNTPAPPASKRKYLPVATGTPNHLAVKLLKI